MKRITKKEIDEAIKTLDMDNFFHAVKEVRLCGVPMYDEEHDRVVCIPVEMDKMAQLHPEFYDENGSLDSVLYGVYDAVVSGKHPECETRGFFDDAYRRMPKDRTWGAHKDAWAHRALVETFWSWLRYDLEEIMSDPRFLPSEEEVLELCRQLDSQPMN